MQTPEPADAMQPRPLGIRSAAAKNSQAWRQIGQSGIVQNPHRIFRTPVIILEMIDTLTVEAGRPMDANATNPPSPTKPARFGIGHAVVFGVLWFGFTVLTYAAVSGGLSNASQERGLVILTTLGTISGPMTGAISRRFQGCCLQASLTLLPYAATGLLLGSLFQIAPLPHRVGWQVLRLGAWGLGWFVWFGSGIISFAHALS